MSFYSFQPLHRSFLQHEGLPFADVLSEETIARVAKDAGVPLSDAGADIDVVYTPAVTLWAFLSQVLHQKAQRSCTAAVARVVLLCVALGREPCSSDTGAYCRARKRLPLVLVQRLTYHVADAAEAKTLEGWLWKRKHVFLVDGTTVSAPDTPALQAKYPQPSTQKRGVGFPLIRLVVLMSLATAMLNGMALGPYAGKETGETALFRQLLDRLKPGDVLLADRYFCSYFMVALLQERKIDCVMRLHQSRKADFTRGRQLGHSDHVVHWHRPQRPAWMDQATYDRMPVSIEVREVHVQVKKPGFRVDSLVVVTTLTDAANYPQEDLATLYRQRWHVELDIEALKITLGMDVLRCKTPEMVEKEIWVGLLAYNVIRQVALQAALEAERLPRQISFSAALQAIAASWTTILCLDDEQTCRLIVAYLSGLASHQVGDRPDRVEPRAIKRRPKPHRLLTEPRNAAKAKLAHPIAA
jgi:IS4 transposase